VAAGRSPGRQPPNTALQLTANNRNGANKALQNLWHASIPLGERTVEADGACTVQLRDGLIYANHVFFDRTELLSAPSNP
jgi:hypothetical protein